jgi:acyl-CoA reductase-like NAD-dependent aldehyde dehydrogenase
MVETYKAFIAGEYTDSKGQKTMDIINPATGKLAARVARCGVEDIQHAVDAAEQAGHAWAATPVSERAKVLLRASQLIMQHREELALLETMEHGSPIRKNHELRCAALRRTIGVLCWGCARHDR